MIILCYHNDETVIVIVNSYSHNSLILYLECLASELLNETYANDVMLSLCLVYVLHLHSALVTLLE